MSEPEEWATADADAAGASNPLLVFFDRVEQRADAAARRQRSYELLGARAGARIADVGCGAGLAVRELAARVAPGGSVTGVDINQGLLRTAVLRAQRSEVPVRFENASVDALPFAPATIDGYRAERLYQHLPDPVKALAEALRVLAPGGRIVLVDQDWDTMLFDSDDRATTRLLLRAFSDGVVNCAVGRQYHRLLGDAGFVDVKVHAEAFTSTSFEEHGFFAELIAQVGELSGAVSSRAAATWLDEQRERGQRGRFFMAITHFLGTGRR